MLSLQQQQIENAKKKEQTQKEAIPEPDGQHWDWYWNLYEVRKENERKQLFNDANGYINDTDFDKAVLLYAKNTFMQLYLERKLVFYYRTRLLSWWALV